MATFNNTKYNNTDLVIYHGGCPDGTAGAWAFWRVLGDKAKYFPGVHMQDDRMPDVNVDGLNVVFVDFTYRSHVIEKMLTTAKSIRILDHHISAKPLTEIVNDKYSIVLDMNRSGAQLAWDELYSSDSRPWFVDAIADRDLWKWQVPNSKDLCMGMFGLGYYRSIEKFNQIQYVPMDYFLTAGIVLNKKEDDTVSNLVSRATDCIATSNLDPNLKWKVRVVDCSHEYSSEVGNKLTKDDLCDFAITVRYNVPRDEWWCSARASDKSNINLPDVLKHFDPFSGGHAKAAGFKLPQGKSLRSILTPCETSFQEMLKQENERKDKEKADEEQSNKEKSELIANIK